MIYATTFKYLTVTDRRRRTNQLQGQGYIFKYSSLSTQMCTPFLESKGLFSGVCTLFSFLRERFDSLDGYLVLNGEYFILCSISQPGRLLGCAPLMTKHLLETTTEALLYYIPVKHYHNDKALPVDGNLFQYVKPSSVVHCIAAPVIVRVSRL